MVEWFDAGNGYLISEWIDWSGGDLPVDPDTLVQVELRGPPKAYNSRTMKARDLHWGHSKSHYNRDDILRYRIIKQG